MSLLLHGSFLPPPCLGLPSPLMPQLFVLETCMALSSLAPCRIAGVLCLTVGKKKVILHFKELSFNSEGDPDLLKCPMWSPCWACCPSDKTPYSPSRIFDRCFWKCIDSYNSSNQVKKMVSILLKALSARSLLWSGVQKTLWLWQAVLKFLSQKEEDVISLREILALPICFNNTNNGCT